MDTKKNFFFFKSGVDHQTNLNLTFVTLLSSGKIDSSTECFSESHLLIRKFINNVLKEDEGRGQLKSPGCCWPLILYEL